MTKLNEITENINIDFKNVAIANITPIHGENNLHFLKSNKKAKEKCISYLKEGELKEGMTFRIGQSTYPPIYILFVDNIDKIKKQEYICQMTKCFISVKEQMVKNEEKELCICGIDRYNDKQIKETIEYIFEDTNIKIFY